MPSTRTSSQAHQTQEHEPHQDHVPPPMIILAAGQGSRLRPLTDHQPKCMVTLAQKPLIQWQLETAHTCGVQSIHIVGGYQHQVLNQTPQSPCHNLPVIINDRYESTNMVYSLKLALDRIDSAEDLIISYGDIVYETSVLNTLIQSPHDASIIVDKDWADYWKKRATHEADDGLSDTESLIVDSNNRIYSIGQPLIHAQGVMGQYIGLMRFKGASLVHLKKLIQIAAAQPTVSTLCAGRCFESMYMTDLLQALINHGQALHAVWTQAKWLEIDTPDDLALAEQLVKPKPSQSLASTQTTDSKNATNMQSNSTVLHIHR